MAFEVLGTVALPVLIRFNVGDDGGTVLLSLREVGIDVVDVDQHPIDYVRHRRPLLRRLATLAMMPRSLVIGRRGGQHDDAVTGLHLAMTEPAVPVQHPGAFLEAKR